MRRSPLHERFARSGAAFEERYGIQIPTVVGGSAGEYHLVRNTVGISDFSHMSKFRIGEETGIDFLDTCVAGNVARVRFGRVLHTFLADSDGHLVADCYIANNDEEFVVLCESIVDDAAIHALFDSHGAAAADLEDLSDTHAVIGIDGFKAWAVVRDLFGTDVLGLPYLSIEVYPFEGGEVRLFRCGKTSEFGYAVMAPAALADPLFAAIVEAAQKHEGGLCGLSVHNDLRLEGRFFNIYAEGARVRDPLMLGLQWMIDFDKDHFCGREAIVQRRQRGVEKKIIGVKVDGGAADFIPGAMLFDEARPVASVEAACFSHVLNARIGLALFPREIAYAGLSFRLGSAGGAEVQTISMPPIMPKSLTVKLDEM